MDKKKRKFRFPIRWKAITMIVALAVVIIEVAVAYYSIMISKLNRETYSMVAKDTAAGVAHIVDVEDFKYVKEKVKAIVDASETKPIAEEATEEEFNNYIVQFDVLKDDPVYVAKFNTNLEILRKQQTANIDFVDCIYLTYVDSANHIFVYLIDAAEEGACPAGCIDPIYEMNEGIYTHPEDGFKPYVTKTELYGWLITAGSPIYDGEEIVGFAMVDVSMYTVRERQASSIVRLFFYMLASLFLVGVLGVVWVSLWMIKPLKKLTDLSLSYNSDDPKGTHQRFQAFENHSHDEITDLTDSIKLMEHDVYDRFNALLDTNKQLLSSREETKKMAILANQDGLTGVHNKVAYNSEVERINKEIKDKEELNFAVVMIDLNYLKEVNDTFGHDTGDVALIRLASMICSVFAYSPVYRVGGDEFVVICRGKDYQKITNLILSFKKKIDESMDGTGLHDGEHISAAIGYAIFDEKIDKTVDNVFKRADKAMYENKREIKGEK